MIKNAYKTSDLNLVWTFSVTILFNTTVALLLHLFVKEMDSFGQVFISSQIMGLSICSCVTFAIHYSRQSQTTGMVIKILSGLFAGVLAGSMFCWLFMYITQGINFRLYLKDAFLITFAFGIIFGMPAVYFFVSWSRIKSSEKKLQMEKIKRLTLEKEAAITTFKLLQAQIEPHFLFNTLSTVITLFDIDVVKAKKMLVDFNEYIRISLQRTRQEMVTLDQELEFLTCYLEIFKIRLGQRLSYEIMDHSKAPNISLPPMILQPIVENAIKYGIEPKPEGGRITIDFCIENGFLKILIADTGMGFDSNKSRSGIGLNNVSTRLETMYGNQTSLIITENKPSGVKVIVMLPL